MRRFVIALLILGPAVAFGVWTQRNVDQRVKDAVDAYDRGEFSRAVEVFKYEAERGHLRAMSRLSNVYWDGKGVPKNREVALSWRLISRSVAEDPVAREIDTLVIRIYTPVMTNYEIEKAKRLAREWRPLPWYQFW